ncbi:MAG: fimbrillin family protein [Bacteroidaceae bacterium]|nr:fimbrillin family protein [Bacteroidaceae bacterium]
MSTDKQVPLEIELKGIETRAIIEGSTLPDCEFGMFVTDADGNIEHSGIRVYYMNNSVYKWDKDVMLNEADRYVYACYPYTGDYDGMNIAVSAGETDYLSGYAANSDLQKAPVNANNPKASIYMKHLLSRITLNICKAEGNNDNLELYYAGFKGTYSSGWYNMKNGEFASRNANDYKIVMKSAIGYEPTKVEILAIPTETLEGVQLCLDGETLGCDIYNIPMPAGEWKAGQQYTYNIVFESPEKVSISAADITPWEPNNQDEIIVGNENEIKPKAVDLGLSVKWASCNVGATSPEEYGGYYAWGETEEKEDYSASTSLTYGLSESELQSRGIIGEDGNLTASYDVAATKWGGDWRMPTQAELQELVEKCTWEWTTQNGVNGRKVTGPNGIFIFLPAAGNWYDTDLNNVGSIGGYWSATPYNYVNRAYDLSFGSGGYYWSHNNRYFGNSVRPVSE